MKIETFFENFELLTDAPNATARLRELILDLAVRGKLVPQVPSDKPAQDILKEIKAEKEQLIKKGKIKKSKFLADIRPNKITYDLPESWEWVMLGDIGESNIGLTYSPSNVSDTGIPVLRSNNIQDGRLDLTDLKRVNIEIKESCFVQDGDLLICARNGSKNLVGKTARIQDLPEPMAFGAFMTIFRSIFNEYLFYFINSPLFRRMINDVNTMTINQITQQNLKSTIFPLPPLAEQKRIVEKCDRLLSTCDEIEKRQQQRQESILRMNESAIAQLLSSQNSDDFRQHWQRICNNFDLLYSIPETIPKLRQAILQLAVQGKLVRQDPNDEPASALIKRMISKRDKLIANKKINNYKPQPPVQLDEITFNLLNGWEFVRLGEITDIVSGVTKGRNLTGRKTAYYPYLRVANVQRGFLDLEVIKEIEIPVEELEKYRLQVGDILLTEGGDWDKLGRSTIWQGQIQDCIHQNHVFRARPLDDGLLSEWAVMYTNSPVGRQYFETAAKRTTNLASINMTQLRYCPFPLPPLAEQKRIVEKCDRLMSLCDTLEARLKQGRDSSEKLMDIAAKQVLTA